MDDEEVIPLDDVTRNADGSFTINRPGWYTFGGIPIARATQDGDVRTVRELPKDEPAGRYEGKPEKWRTMNRAARRAAKRGRSN